MNITYPLYLIPLEAGYVSVVDTDSEDVQTYFLAVFTEEELATTFMGECGIEGEPRALKNGREFSWMVQSLRAPISSLAFDPLATSTRVEARWTVSVADLLKDHIVVDLSPWDYPVYFIEQPNGYACIEGSASTGEETLALGLFTTEEKATAYLQDAGEEGTVKSLADLSATRQFLQQTPDEITAVALNLTVDAGQRTAKYCFTLSTVLDKYLVEQKGEPS